MFQPSCMKLFKLHVFFPPCSVLGMRGTPSLKLKNFPYRLGKLSCQTLMRQGNEESQQNTRGFAWYPKVNQKNLLALSMCGVYARCILITMFFSKSSDHQRPMSQPLPMTPSMTEQVLPFFPRPPVYSNCASVWLWLEGVFNFKYG